MINEKWIDLSAYQGATDMAQVKGAGYAGVIIRAGYGNDASQQDKQFLYNIWGAIAVGLKVAVYWFNYCDSVEDAKKEWAVCKAIIDPYKDKICFVSADYEYDSVKYFKKIHGAAPDNALINQMVDTFLAAVQADGYDQMMYLNNDYRRNVYTQSLLAKYKLWLADYEGEPDVPCAMRQTGSTGRVPGINGNVDTDECLIDINAPQSTPVHDPVPQPAPAPLARFSKGDTVKVTNAVTYDGKPFALYYPKYDVIEVSGARVVIGIGGTVTAAVHQDNLQLASASVPTPAPAAPAAPAILKGGKVKVLNAVTYNGAKFATYYPEYDVIEVSGDRAVIGIGGTVTAAINVCNLQAV